mmetsp:Transcript_48099/g.89621  ORF Transcript_48099/g.89621 Transcript_48099/m.89621 type:complete len:122 (+) Transcript_48099:482-847(+)
MQSTLHIDICYCECSSKEGMLLQRIDPLMLGIEDADKPCNLNLRVYFHDCTTGNPKWLLKTIYQLLDQAQLSELTPVVEKLALPHCPGLQNQCFHFACLRRLLFHHLLPSPQPPLRYHFVR